MNRRAFLGAVAATLITLNVSLGFNHAPRMTIRTGLPTLQWRPIYPPGSYAGLHPEFYGTHPASDKVFSGITASFRDTPVLEEPTIADRLP